MEIKPSSSGFQNNSTNTDSKETKKFGFASSNISFSQLKTQSDSSKSFWENEAKREEGIDDKPQPEIELKTADSIVTGEEDEKTLFSSKAKLFVLPKGQQDWTERGVGTMKINEDHNRRKRLSISLYQ